MLQRIKVFITFISKNAGVPVFFFFLLEKGLYTSFSIHVERFQSRTTGQTWNMSFSSTPTFSERYRKKHNLFSILDKLLE